MKRAGGVFLAVLLANVAFGQQITRNFGSVVFPGGGTGPNITRTFGSVVFPGGSPTSPIVRTGPSGRIVAPPAFNGRAGATAFYGGGNSFNGGGNSFHRPGGGRGGHNNNSPSTVFAYPVFAGGGYGASYDTPSPEAAMPGSQQPNVTMVYPPPQQEVRPVIIQMSPEPRSYRQPERQPEVEPAPVQTEPDAPHYLIAFKDHTIYSSVAYWFDGDTLHYFTNGNTHNQASVELIDRALTERLNREMGTDFKMPAAAK